MLCYGRNGVEQPKIQRLIWSDTVLGCEERCAAKAICAKLLNTTVARGVISRADRMVDAENLPLWGFPDKCREVSISGFRKLQVEGETGAHTNPLDKYRGRPAGDDQISLYSYVAGRGAPLCLQGRRSVRSCHLRKGTRARCYFCTIHGARRATACRNPPGSGFQISTGASRRWIAPSLLR